MKPTMAEHVLSAITYEVTTLVPFKL